MVLCAAVGFPGAGIAFTRSALPPCPKLLARQIKRSSNDINNQLSAKASCTHDLAPCVDQPKIECPSSHSALYRNVAILVALETARIFLVPESAQASFSETVVASIRGTVPDAAAVFLLGALPLIELRGAVPVGIVLLGMDPAQVFVLAALGNLLPVPLLLAGLGPLANALSGVPILKRVLDSIFSRARKQGASWKENEFWALALFVGIPLPGTGAWSGAIGAFVLGMKFWDAIFANFVGILIAGALMVTLTLMGWPGLFVGAAILLGAPTVALMVKSMKAG